ncbi:MAG: octanoyltransferase [Deltaproteobacteria bacterium]|nr:MAG: octanoyltransferase [Deltaproteobacteria bacterium]
MKQRRPENHAWRDSERGMKRERIWHIAELGTQPYRPVLDLQHRLVEELQKGELETDTVLLLEHEPVFTLGHNGGRENLTVSEKVLKQKGIEVVETERGGNITYHGPGQIIAYPIIRMNRLALGIPEYVEGLEEVMLRTSSDWGVRAERNSLNHGIWVGRRKLGSVGIAIRRGISFHGIALNVNLSLEPFCWINPCGLSGVAMTSLEEEGAQNVDVALVREGIVRHLAAVFGIRTAPITLQVLERSFLHEEWA